MRAIPKSSYRPLGSPVELITAPHADFATFQRVWNPDTNSDYSPKDFSEDGDEADSDVQSDCGEDGKGCPEVPSFGGEDYFDSKPIGFLMF